MIPELSVSSIKTYLNRVLIFKGKQTISPESNCLYIEDDKAEMFNGETGVLLSWPFFVEQPTLLWPSDLAYVVNSLKEDAEIKFRFDYNNKVCNVQTEAIDLKIRLLDPATFKRPPMRDQIALSSRAVKIENFHDKVKRASFCCADNPDSIFQAVKFGRSSVCAASQNAIWRERSATITEDIILPKLLREQIERLDLEPTTIALEGNQIIIYYNDTIVYGTRLAEEDKFLDIDNIFDEKVKTVQDTSVVQYDREALERKLRMLLSLSGKNNTVKMQCAGGILSVQNAPSDSAATEGLISMDVSATAGFENVLVNGELLLDGVKRFAQFSVKADDKRLLFWNDDQEYCIGRKAL